jgi:hypothetical protein
MGRLSVVMAFLLAAACGGAAETGPKADPLGPYPSREALVEAVGCGEAGPDVFVRAVRQGPMRLEDVPPEAVANYLEALAWERMLNRVPTQYTTAEEMRVSYETVFEDPRNVFNNWEAYKFFLRRVYKADLG